jgi:hypothetical protein
MCAWGWPGKLEAYRIIDCAYLFDEAVIMASLENRKVTRWSLPSAASKKLQKRASQFSCLKAVLPLVALEHIPPCETQAIVFGSRRKMGDTWLVHVTELIPDRGSGVPEFFCVC